MGDLAKIFWSGRSQAVRLPKQYRFEGGEVRIRREGARIVLEPLDESLGADAIGQAAADEIDRLRALIERGYASGEDGEWDPDEIKREGRRLLALDDED